MSVRRLQNMGRADARACTDDVARADVKGLASESWWNVAVYEAENEGIDGAYPAGSAEEIYCAAFVAAYSERKGWTEPSKAKPRSKAAKKGSKAGAAKKGSKAGPAKPARKPKRPELPLRALTVRGDPDGEKLAAVRRYVESGADVDALLPQGEVFMQSLLHLAAAQHHLEMMRYLLSKGADPNLANGTNGERPLHAAVSSVDEPEAAALLLEHGAEVDARSGPGSTPLHDAVVMGHARIVELLLGHGADPAIETPYMLTDGKPSTAHALCAQQLARGRPGQARIKKLLDRAARGRR